MSRAMNPRSVAIELPARGAVLACLDVAADVVEHHLLSGGHIDRRCPHLLGEPRLVVHLRDDLDHPGQRVVGCVDDDVDAVAEDVEVGIGHQGCDLDEPVGLQVKPGHLTVDPHQFVTHSDQQ